MYHFLLKYYSRLYSGNNVHATSTCSCINLVFPENGSEFKQHNITRFLLYKCTMFKYDATINHGTNYDGR